MKNEMTLIAGPCVIESRDLVFQIAESLKKQLNGLPLNFYFKASFDKANRTSLKGFRGPGMEEGLKILSDVKSEFGFQLLTDIHQPEQASAVAEVVDYLQIPAFLCRQTDLVLSGARAALKNQKRLNIKKGQFLAPWDAKNIIQKVNGLIAEENLKAPSEDWLTITERGTSFGYNTLVVDMISFQEIQKEKVPVIYDVTHSIQSPGAGKGGTSTGGNRQYLEVLARAAISAGVNGLFLECHPDPSNAKSDGPNALYLDKVGDFVKQMLKIQETVQNLPKLLKESQE